MKIRLMLIVLLGTLFSSYSANAEKCAQKGNTLGVIEEESSGSIGVVGEESSGSIRVEVSDHQGQCDCDVFRFSSADVDVEMVLLSLSNAKASGHKVQIDISEADNCDSAYGVVDTTKMMGKFSQVGSPYFN